MKIINGYKPLFFLFWCVAVQAENNHAWTSVAWTWLFSKQFSEVEQQQAVTRDQLVLSKYDVPRFTQLLFSFNAKRQGTLSFYVSVQDAKSGIWSRWFRALDWGTSIQQSYKDASIGQTSYHHVRLEIPSGQYASAFRVKVAPKEGARLSQVKALYVCVCNKEHFEHEYAKQVLKGRPTVILNDVPAQSQMELAHERANHMCSPTSTSMLVGFLLGQTVKPLDFAVQVYDTGLDSFGSWPFNTAHAYECCPTHAFWVMRLPSFVDLYNRVAQGIPVVVSVRGPLQGAAKAYESGHLLVVMGIDTKHKKVLCHDPAFESDDRTAVSYDVQDFINAWERSHRLAYIAETLTA